MDPEMAKAVEALLNLLPDVYKDAAQPAMRKVGRALGDSFQFCALPFTALGTLAQAVEKNLAHHLENYTKKLDAIPQEKVVPVHPQIMAPVVQKLTYTTNEEIAKLYINLLTTASNVDTTGDAHPGFENIISQLSADEARILQYLQNRDDIQYCELKAYVANGDGYNTLLEQSTMVPFRVHLDFPRNIHAYYANMIRLGILVDMINVFRIANGEYDKIKEVYNFSQYDHLVPKVFKKLEFKKSYFEVTPFGRMFIKACTSDSK